MAKDKYEGLGKSVYDRELDKIGADRDMLGQNIASDRAAESVKRQKAIDKARKERIAKAKAEKAKKPLDIKDKMSDGEKKAKMRGLN